MGYMESQVVAGKSYDTPYLFDTKHLRELVASNNIEELKQFMKENNLIIRNHKIVSKFDDEIVKQQAYWNLTQKIYKISINSTYGALLTSGSKWYDVDQGRSITLTGQNITRHMTSFAIQEMTGDYDYLNDGVKIGDTDSKIGSTEQRVLRNGEEIRETVEELFNNCISYFTDERTGKEYGFTKDMVLGYDDESDSPKYYNINYVYRHKTSKQKWEIEDEDGNIITVTSDHSCMVERNGKLIEVKPSEILEEDIVITINDTLEIKRSKIKRCECVGTFDNEYVYDIGISDDRRQWEFSNNILVHNSCYISISDAFKSKGKQYNMSIEELVDYADEIGEKVNASFPEFMHNKFGVDLEHGAIIKAGRENVFYSCLCVVKKHYAGLVVNADGHYIYSKVAIHISDSDMKKYIDLGEINGKHYIHSPKGVIYSEVENGWCPLGKLKITGLDELRSDVSPEVKVLLRKILCIILLGGGKNIVEDLVIEKYNEIKKKTHWELGMPKSCKNVSEWEEKIGIIDSNYESSTLDNLVINKGINLSDENGDKFGKVIVPAVASACINWNRLRLLNNDRTSPQLMNGHRLIFMKLKYPNQYNIKNIALPYDISVIPEWFKNLPFDDEAMIQSIFMKKIENITKPMNWTFDLHRDIWENQFEDVEYE